MLEKADSLTDGQLQVNDNSCLHEIGQDDRRSNLEILYF